MALPQQEELYGLDKEIDYYGVLNLPSTASSEQIQRKFRKLSLYTHPDKAMGRESHEQFVQMQKAYGYLTNPTTRIIYDRFGVAGIKVFEMYTDEFRELSEELRTRDLEEGRRQQIQDEIVKKSERFIKVNLRNQIQLDHQKQYMFEVGVNMKAFCKYYHQFYYAGQSAQAIKLIRTRSVIATINFGMPFFGYKNQRLDFQATTQNDVKKGLGICSFKLGHTWQFDSTTTVRSAVNVKHGDHAFNFDIGRSFLKNQVHGRLKFTVNKHGRIMPSINFSSNQLAPIEFNGGYNLASDMVSVGFKKDLQKNNLSNEVLSKLGYSCHVNIGKNAFGLMPQLVYAIRPDITISTSWQLNVNGSTTAQIGFSYDVTKTKSLSLFYQHAYKDFISLDNCSMVMVYNHNGYLFKMPVSLGGKFDDMPTEEDREYSFWMSLGVATLANLAMYGAYWLAKREKVQHNEKALRNGYAAYISNIDRVNTYIRENQIFYQSSFNNETKTNGLIVIEAYFGLDEHIYQIEAGLLLFVPPQTPKEYSKSQILPVTKQLQLQVQAGELRIPADFGESVRGVFNPCLNQRSKTMLYLRYKYRQLEKVVVYDFSRVELVVPRDV